MLNGRNVSKNRSQQTGSLKAKMLNALLGLLCYFLLLLSFHEASEKVVPPTINYLYLPEPYVCPRDIAVTAGHILSRNWCDLLATENLNLLQAGLYNSSATLHAVWYDSIKGKCVDTGVAPYLNVLVPMMYNRTTCAEITPTSVVVDSYNRVIVYADSISLRGDRVTNDQLLFIMEPSCPGKRGCSYKIIYQQYYDTFCLSQLMDSYDSI